MTKPFFFADLNRQEEPPTSGATDEPCKPVADESHESTFPHFAFDRPRSKRGGKAKHLYTEEDLAVALDEVRQAIALDVEIQTRAALSDEISNRQIKALEAIRNQLGANDKAIERWMTDVTVIVQRLALMIGQAIVPRALEKRPLADIGDMVRQCLVRLSDQPLIELHLEPDLVEQATDLLTKVSQEAGYHGQLVAIADQKIGPGAARMTWKHGVVERNLNRIQDEVEMLVNAWFHDTTGETQAGQEDSIPTSLAEQGDAIKSSFCVDSETIKERSLS